MPGWAELLIVAFIGLVLFGKRLPEVARSLGQSIVEFKKGMQGVKQDVDNAADSSTRPAPPERLPDSKNASAPAQSAPSESAPASSAPSKQPVESGD